MVLNVSCFLPRIIYVLSELGGIYRLTSIFHTFPCVPILSRHSELLSVSRVSLPMVTCVLLCPFCSVTPRVACTLFSCFISHRKLFPFLLKLLQTPADWFPLDSAIDLFKFSILILNLILVCMSVGISHVCAKVFGDQRRASDP